MTLRDCPVHNQFRALAGHLLPLQILSMRNWIGVPGRTHLPPELALRSFRVKLRLTLMSRKEAESGSLSISARPAVQSCFRTLERFPEIFGVYGGNSMSRTGLTARPRRQDTSSWTQLNEARSFLPVSVRFASTRYSMTERRSGVSSFRQPYALRWLARQRLCGLKPESWRARRWDRLDCARKTQSPWAVTAALWPACAALAWSIKVPPIT